MLMLVCFVDIFYFLPYFFFEAVIMNVDLALLVDRRIHEIAKQHRRGPVDSHRYGSLWIGEVEPAV
jgi:hypothetical protein